MKIKNDTQVNDIAIIGIGLIGGSIAKALKSRREITIRCFDREDVTSGAIKSGTVDEVLPDLEAALKSDVIFICLPVDLSVEVFSVLYPKLREDQIISDVCSVKGLLEKTSREIKSAGIYFGGHPMTGREKGGFENSDALLFENSIYLLSDSNENHILFPSFQKLILELGARINLINPYLHDEHIAKVSHLPQLVSVALMNSVTRENNEVLNFAAGGFRDMTRIASSKFDIWKSIILSNKNLILNELNSLRSELSRIENDISDLNLDQLEFKFENARVCRDEIPKNNKGFLFPLHDVYVFVKDQPGIVSKISTALFEQEINIKDIELMKIREGTGGTFRLSFESEKDAGKAVSILNELGFETKTN